MRRRLFTKAREHEEARNTFLYEVFVIFELFVAS